MTREEAGARRRRALPASRWILLALVLLGMLFSSVYPVRRYLAVTAKIEQLEREDRALADRLVELQNEKERLETDAEVERLARDQLGMVKPGEVPFVIVTPRPAASAPPAVAPGGFGPSQPPEDPSVIERWWEAAVRVARAGR